MAGETCQLCGISWGRSRGKGGDEWEVEDWMTRHEGSFFVGIQYACG